jgi:DNA modification methylase
MLHRWHPIYCWNLPKRQSALMTDVLRHPTMAQHTSHPDWNHPGGKPLDLMVDLVRAFGGSSVCDPFVGSGTTAVAADIVGCDYYACDIEQRFVDLANRRLRDSDPYQARTVAGVGEQLSLFAGEKVGRDDRH